MGKKEKKEKRQAKVNEKAAAAAAASGGPGTTGQEQLPPSPFDSFAPSLLQKLKLVEIELNIGGQSSSDQATLDTVTASKTPIADIIIQSPIESSEKIKLEKVVTKPPIEADQKGKGKQKTSRKEKNEQSTSSPAKPKSGKEVESKDVKGKSIPGPVDSKMRRLKTRGDSKVHSLFDHLPKVHDARDLLKEINFEILPCFAKLGYLYSSGAIHGSNKRCKALFAAIRIYISEYETSSEKNFKYEFSNDLNPNLDFLRKCRPFAVAMDNSLEYFRGAIRDLDVESSEEEMKMALLGALKHFEDERIDKAKHAIILKGRAMIEEGDTILIFGTNEIVRDIILSSLPLFNTPDPKKRKRFSLIIVDSRAINNKCTSLGLQLLKNKRFGGNLETLGMNVRYVGLSGLSNYMTSVTKVLLGAHALLSNGGVMAHSGTSQIALLAASHNIPFLVCCETYKFCDKSPTDSFFLNELGPDIEFLEKYAGIRNNHEMGHYCSAPSLVYDVTPPQFITAVITDVDVLPCSSVPVVLRVQETRTIKINLDEAELTQLLDL